MFWQDMPTSRKRSERELIRPPVPETGWKAPTAFPNLSAAVILSIDVETYDPELDESGPGWARGVGEIVGFSVGAQDAHGNLGQWYFPIRHRDTPEDNLDPETCLRWLAEQVSDDRPKVGARLIYDVGWLAQEGVVVKGPLYDVQYAEALLHSESRTVSLDYLAAKYLGEHKDADLMYQWIADYYGIQKNDRCRKYIYNAPPSLVGPYGESDASLPLRIMAKQWPLLVQEGLLDLFFMECELIPLLIAMRFAGVAVDLARAEQYYETLGNEVAAIQENLNRDVGFCVSVNSADDLARAFDAHGIPYGRTVPSERNPEGQPSFTAGFLEACKHPIARSVVDIRQREKIRGTFIKSYILDNHVNGMVYGSFNQLQSDSGGTRSGRFSSDSPNLQNIPIRTAIGKEIRRLFVHDPGHIAWRKYDYSQIEYRMLAHFAVGEGADNVRAQYNADPDIDYHQLVHDLIFNLTGIDLIRGHTKNMNFGLIYGLGEPSLADQLGLALSKAKELFDAYHKGAPFAKATMQATMKEAQAYGVITTILGRKSRFDLWEPADWGVQGIPLPYGAAVSKYGRVKRAKTHKALNRRLQGSAADLMKKAMHRCWKDGIFDATGVPRLTVHDELDFSDPGGRDEAFREMKHVLETALPIRVPVRADYEIGPNWGDVQDPV
jgi:DNA polymerase I-like protein with 3'-5' exonuclease and polymerase domains